MSVTITGMVAANMAADSGWAPEQVLSAITSSISINGGAEPTTVSLSIASVTTTALTTTGVVLLKNLPTSSKGLATGQVYSDSGTLKLA